MGTQDNQTQLTPSLVGIISASEDKVKAQFNRRTRRNGACAANRDEYNVDQKSRNRRFPDHIQEHKPQAFNRTVASLLHAFLLLAVTSLLENSVATKSAETVTIPGAKTQQNPILSGDFKRVNYVSSVIQSEHTITRRDIEVDTSASDDEFLGMEKDEVLIGRFQYDSPEQQQDDDIQIHDDLFDGNDDDDSVRDEPEDIENEVNDSKKDHEGVLIVATVDGTLAGFSKATGEMLWKRSADSQQRQPFRKDTNPNAASIHKKSSRTEYSASGTPPERSSNYSLGPLVSTTTTVENSRTEQWRTVAVPSIMDGKVYLTASDVTVTTTAKELVTRAPFADRRGRIYTGASSSTVVALDGNTGDIIQVVGSGGGYPEGFNDPTQQDPDLGDSNQSMKERNVVWMGRVDYSVTISEPKSGQIDAHFMTSELMSASQMVLKNTQGQQYTDSSVSKRLEPPNGHVLVPADEDHTTHTSISSSGSSFAEDFPKIRQNFNCRYQPEHDIHNRVKQIDSPSVVVTPNGHLAFLDNEKGDFFWVADESFATPIAFCMDSSTGNSCHIETVPDAILPDDDSPDYVSREMKRQLSLLENESFRTASVGTTIPAKSSNLGDGRTTSSSAIEDDEPSTIVGSLPGSGQLYAMPLRNIRRSANFQRSTQQATGNNKLLSAVAQSKPHGSDHLQHTNTGRYKHHATFQANSEHRQQHHDRNDAGFGNIIHHTCSTGSFHIPACLTPQSQFNTHSMLQRNLITPKLHNPQESFLSGEKVDTHEDSGMVPFQHNPDHFRKIFLERHGEYDQYNHLLDYFTRRQEEQQLMFMAEFHRKKRRKLFHFLASAVVIVCVVVAEMERRRRIRDLVSLTKRADDTKNVASHTDEGYSNLREQDKERIINVCEDIVLGYGAHGTTVFEGVLDGRAVAVKRMLTTFHASADREISLLIESDGHPNVVRYFLKEVRGDFVYLALELCDLSLHDLIGLLRQQDDHDISVNATIQDEIEKVASTISNSVKEILFQIATGVRHLHHLRIVHRDLKPANILLARKEKRKSKHRSDVSSESILKSFRKGQYIAKISDMGLGKQLLGHQSSYGTSLLNGSSLCLQSNGASSTIGGKGTVGWQAPEVMAHWTRTDSSMKLEGSNGQEVTDSGSPDDPAVQNGRTSRSTDIFSLGCIFYATLVPGSHPFGEWYERESNIMHNRPNLSRLQQLSPEACDLVSAMLRRSPKSRPTSKQICDHPFFWPTERKLSLLCDLSDRLEITDPGENSGAQHLKLMLCVERNATQIVGRSWDQKIESELLCSVQRYRSYDSSSVRDLLRLIRNKHHHFDELPSVLKESMGSNILGLMNYFASRFPKLLIHCCHVCLEALGCDNEICLKYTLDPVWNECAVRMNTALSTISDKSSENCVSFNEDEKDDELKGNACVLDSLEPQCLKSNCDQIPCDRSEDAFNSQLETPATYVTKVHSLSEFDERVESDDNDEELIVWQGSTAASLLNCRGWSRSDDEWVRKGENTQKRRDANLVRGAEDLKFRTRLCNHWDLSFGTSCPLRKKNKCVFAHGPVELRVKEGKRNRWGKLVDNDGNCLNPKHSGGEDTYGAACAIELERKEEGKWNTPNKSVNNRKKKPPTKKLSKVSSS